MSSREACCVEGKPEDHSKEKNMKEAWREEVVRFLTSN